uniref:UPAR/Ly6 domain-containing protein n=1 Tax=Steinernema glaseri TaxID=37863 RepID=A0A1I7YDC7_9BILA
MRVEVSGKGASVGLHANATCSGSYCFSGEVSHRNKKMSAKSCGEAAGCTAVRDMKKAVGGVSGSGRCCKGDFCNHGAALPVVTLSAVAVAFLKLFVW